MEELLEDQVARALLYECNDESPRAYDNCSAIAKSITEKFVQTLPHLRGLLLLDVDACMRGDPAAHSPEEVILCYPGMSRPVAHPQSWRTLTRGGEGGAESRFLNGRPLTELASNLGKLKCYIVLSN